MKARNLMFILAAIIGGLSSVPLPALTLSAALARTVENNPAIQQAKCELEEAAGQRLVLRANAWPDARFGVVIGVQGGHRAGEDAVQPFGFARGGFTQPLFDAAIPASGHRGDVGVLIAQQRLNLAIVSELHTTRTAFYGALYNQSLQSLRTAQRQALSENVAAQESLYRSGQTERPALTAAALLEEELPPRIEEARRGYGDALLQIARGMGSDLGPDAQRETPVGELRFASLKVDVESESTAAIQQRPDLKLARLLVRAAAEDQRIIEAAYYPRINLVIDGTYIPVSGIRRGSEGSPRRSDDIVSSELREGVAYTWRVVDNGKVGGAVLRQKSVREINELLYKKLESNVPRELAQIYNNLQAIESRHRSLEDALRAATASAAAVQQNLAQGLLSQLDFRNAESSLLETQSGLLDLAFEQNLALAEWDRATGRYFRFSNDTSGNRH